MDFKTLLVAGANRGVVEAFREALEPEWQVSWFADGLEAITELKRREYKMLVTGLDAGDSRAAELLNYTRRKHPTMPRFILASEADKLRVMKEALGAHQFLTEPIDGAALKQNLDRAMNLDAWLGCAEMRRLVTRVRSLPAVPAVYLELVSALRSPSVTTEEVADIISKDMAISAKLLQVVNSAYFGYSNKTTELSEVVGMLGFESVKSLATAIRMLAHYDGIKLPDYSIEELWGHSNEVAKTARQLVMAHNGNREMAEAAFLAGLLHDIGKVVLAGNFARQYNGTQSLAAKQSLPAWEVEKEIFGATHSEVGAFLLGLWGMPMQVLEAVAFHHHPLRDNSREFTVLTAVHVANALHYELHSGFEVRKAVIDEEYLSQIGLLACLPSWRMAVGSGDFSIQKSTPTTVQIRGESNCFAMQTASAGGQEEPQSSPPGAVSRPRHCPFSFIPPLGNLRRQVMLGVAGFAAIVLAAALASWKAADNEDVPTVSARDLSQPAEVDGAVHPHASAAPGEAPGDAREELHSPPRESGPDPSLGEGSGPMAQGVDTATPPVPAPAIEPPGGPQPAVNPVETKIELPPAFPELRLQGIFITKTRPTAILNEKTLTVNDRLGDVRVVSISSSNVTVEYRNQQKTLRLGSRPVR